MRDFPEIVADLEAATRRMRLRLEERPLTVSKLMHEVEVGVRVMRQACAAQGHVWSVFLNEREHFGFAGAQSTLLRTIELRAWLGLLVQTANLLLHPTMRGALELTGLPFPRPVRVTDQRLFLQIAAYLERADWIMIRDEPPIMGLLDPAAARAVFPKGIVPLPEVWWCPLDVKRPPGREPGFSSMNDAWEEYERQHPAP